MRGVYRLDNLSFALLIEQVEHEFGFCRHSEYQNIVLGTISCVDESIQIFILSRKTLLFEPSQQDGAWSDFVRISFANAVFEISRKLLEVLVCHQECL